MNFRNKILMVLVVVALLGIELVAVKSVVDYQLIGTEANLSKQIVFLEEQIESLYSILTEELKEISNEAEKTIISLAEMKRRQEVRQQSQDEILTGVVGSALPSTISIVVSKDVQQLEIEYVNPFGNDPFFKDFGFRVPVYKKKEAVYKEVGAGTGFIVTKDGYVVTNRHVANDTSAYYTALLSDGTSKEAQIIYIDPQHDITILKIWGDFKAISLGDSDKIKLGQTVVAIGNALGELNNSVSVGIVSGLNRNIQASDSSGYVEEIRGVIQTDAAINKGNSGGPLLDLSGDVIGVNVATATGSENISFSIPINLIKNTLKTALGRNF